MLIARKISLVFILVQFLLAGCDKIESPYRTIPEVNDFCTTGIEDSVVHKKVLVEEYTGFLCGNCPAAGIYLNDTLKQTYNHCLVTVSIHSGFFAVPCGQTGGACPGGQPAGSFLTDFSSPVGDEWYDFFNVPTNPLAIINRAAYPTPSMYVQKSKWSTKISAELALPAEAKLTLQTTYNSANRNVSIQAKSTFLNDLTGDYKLQVLLTEDSVVDWQLWYSHTPEYVSDYVHRHVLRDVVNSLWGETIATGNISSGDVITKNYNYTLNSSWDANRCNIVAFVYNATNYYVLQTEEAKVIE